MREASKPEEGVQGDVGGVGLLGLTRYRYRFRETGDRTGDQRDRAAPVWMQAQIYEISRVLHIN
jgi:hypothetical protein